MLKFIKSKQPFLAQCVVLFTYSLWCAKVGVLECGKLNSITVRQTRQLNELFIKQTRILQKLIRAHLFHISSCITFVCM